MSKSKWLLSAGLVCALGVGSACAPKTEDQTTKIGDAVDKAVDKVVEETKDAAEKVEDKSKEIAGEIADKSKEVVSATGEAITDGWITTKVSAKFADEKLLKGSSINVDTKDHVVTLKGTVGSDAAKGRAATIARGSEGVVRVVDQLVVKVR